MENKAVPKRVVCFDALNVLACLSVIAMHCNGAVHVFADTYVWRQSLLVDVLAYWAVPVFIMLSGATLMRYRERYTTKEFLRRRFLKTGIPLVVWTAVFYVYYRAEGTITWTGWRALLNSLINFTIVPVYWFFSPLFLVYLSLPVLSRLSDDRRVLWYMTGLGFASCSVLPFVCSALQLTYWGNFAFPMLGGYLIFAVLGYLLYTTELSLWQRIVLYALGAFGAVVRYFHTAIASVQEGAINKLTWEHQNWPTVLLAAAVFVFVKYACRYPLFQREKFVRLVKWLSGASFGIYLIHVFIMEQITYRFSINTLSGWWRLFGAFAVYFVALLLVKVFRQMFVSIKIYTVRIAELTGCGLDRKDKGSAYEREIPEIKFCDERHSHNVVHHFSAHHLPLCFQYSVAGWNRQGFVCHLVNHLFQHVCTARHPNLRHTHLRYGAGQQRRTDAHGA